MSWFESRERIRALVMAKFLVTEAMRNMESLVMTLPLALGGENHVSLNFRRPALKVSIGLGEEAWTCCMRQLYI